MFIEKKIYDLAADDWPISEPDGKIYYQKAHLHKGSFITRSGGSLILKTEKTTKESAGIRVIIRTIPNAWYKLRVRAALFKGDQAFVLAQDLHINYIKTRAKLTLGIPLIPRSYFFLSDTDTLASIATTTDITATTAPLAPETEEPKEANTEFVEMTEYLLYFKAVSKDTIVGLLFFSKDIEYEIGITDFICYEFADPKLLTPVTVTPVTPVTVTPVTPVTPVAPVASESVVPVEPVLVAEVAEEVNGSIYKQGILLDFPLADFNANLGDLRRFGLGTYPEEVRLISCRIPNEQKYLRRLPLYILTIDDNHWLYLHSFEIDIDYETKTEDRVPYILELEVEEIHRDLYLEYLKSNVKLPISIVGSSKLAGKETAKTGIIEIRTDAKILFYYADLHGFNPRVYIEESLFNLQSPISIKVLT